MAKSKYKKTLITKTKEDLAYEQSQKQLKEKFQINQPEVVIVEKFSIIKFITQKLIALLRLMIIIILLTLAMLGLTALIYPAPRTDLFQIFQQAGQLLQSYIK